MLKRLFLIAFVLCLFSTVAQAQPAFEQELPSWIEVNFAAVDDSTDGASKAFCSANCQGQGSASCSGSTCSAVDRNCAAGQRGYAQCGSTKRYCNPCPIILNCSIDGFCNPLCVLDPDCGSGACVPGASCLDGSDCGLGSCEVFGCLCPEPN